MTRLALTFIVGLFLFVAGGTGGAWALSKYPWSGKTNAHVCNMVKNGEGQWFIDSV